MFVDMISNRIIGAQGCGKDKSQFVLSDYIAGFVFDTCFRSCISKTLKSESCLVKMGSLFGIPNIKFNKIGTVQRQKIPLFNFRVYRYSRCNIHTIEIIINDKFLEKYSPKEKGC